MGWLVFSWILLLSFILGRWFLKPIIKQSSGLIFWGISMGIGLHLLTFILFYWSWLVNGNEVVIILFLTLVSCFLSLVSKPWRLRPKLSRSVIAQVTIGLGLTLLLYYFWSQLLFWEDGNLMAGWRTIWGDWAAHLTYATSFGFGNNYPPQLPILHGQVLSYPFLSDFLSGLLLKFGLPLTQAFTLPNTLYSFAFLCSYYFLAREFTNRVTAWLAPLLFIFSGGLGAFIVWFNQSSGLSWSQLLNQEVTNQPDYTIYWMNKLTTELVPQRGFLAALSVTLVCYWLARQLMDKPTAKHFLLGSLLTVSMPLMHAHSFVAIVGVFGFVALYQLIINRGHLPYWHYWLSSLLVVLLIGVSQLVFFYSGNLSSGAGFINHHIGWMAHHGSDNLVWFWFKNVGIILPLAVIGTLLAPRKTKILSLAFWIIFVVGNFVLFQPYDYDNTKAFSHWFLMACILAGYTLWRLVSWKRFLAPVSLVLLLLSLTSGLIDVAKLFRSDTNIPLIQNDRLAAAEWVRNNTPTDAVFATAQNHNHWLPVLTGRQMVVGFEGWLWSYNLDYHQHSADLRDLFQGVRVEEIIQKYGIEYLVIGPEERSSLNPYRGSLSSYFAPVYSDEVVTIYQSKMSHPEIK